MAEDGRRDQNRRQGKSGRQTLLLAVVLIILVVVVVLVGAFAVGVVGLPSGGLVDEGDWGTVTEERINVVTTYWIVNPNPVGVGGPGTSIAYSLQLNGIELAVGNKTGFAVPSGNSTDTLTTTLFQQRIPAWWVSHLQNNETSSLEVNTEMTVPVGPTTQHISPPPFEQSVSTNIMDAVASSVAGFEGSYPSDGQPVVVVEDTSARWGPITRNTTTVFVTFTIHNPNPAPLPTPAFAGNVTMNDIEMARWRANEVRVRNAPEDGTIGAGETETITFVTTISNRQIDDWLTSHVKRSERTRLVFTGSLAVTFQGQTYIVPKPHGVRCSARMQTAILIDDQRNSFSFDGCEAGAPSLSNRLKDTRQQVREGLTNITDRQDEIVTPDGTVTPPSVTISPTPPERQTVPETPTRNSDPPTAEIEANTTNGEAPLTVSLNAGGSTDPNGDIKEYVWRFDDVSSPTRGQSVTHTFRTPGQYEVTLTVIDGRGNRATATTTIDVESAGL